MEKNKKAPNKKKAPAKVPARATSTTRTAPKAKVVAAELVDADLASLANPGAELTTIRTSTKPAGGKGSLVPSSTDPVTTYLQELRKYPLLSREEEHKIALRYWQTKDPEAAQVLVTSNLRFVVKVAAEYARFGARMIDLIQEGNVGLMHAVREFDPNKGTRLITYAVWWIRGYIQEYLMKQYSLVKIGTTHAQKKLFYQLQKEKEALDAMGFSPTLQLLSSRLGVSEQDVETMSQRMSGRDVSLDAPLDEDSGFSLKDLRAGVSESPDEALSKDELLGHLKEKIEKIRPSLSTKEQIILDERLLSDDPLTLQEIGEKYSITREAVRQIEAKLIGKLRAQMENLT